MVRKANMVAAVTVAAIVALILGGASFAAGEAVKETLKDRGLRSAFAMGIGAFLIFLVAWGARDLLLRRRRLAARGTGGGR